jgi:AcrR family transcriptional regulator
MVSTKKKTDRRTLYTRNVICEAFLMLKKEKAYNDITVADICRNAEISRGTFYLHYKNTAEVLDEVLDRALSEIHPLQNQLFPESCGATQECAYPMCQYIRNSETYRCLFFDDALSSIIIEKIFSNHKDDLIRMLSVNSELSPEQISMVAYFQLNGCFSAAKRSKDMDNDTWKQTQHMIDCFIRSGLQSLEGK